MRQPGIEPGSYSWEPQILTIEPLALTIIYNNIIKYALWESNSGPTVC